MATGDHAHKMTLEERRAKFFDFEDFVEAEPFESGSVSGSLLEFFKYLDQNTDTFDIVMIEATLELDSDDHPTCKATHSPRLLHYSEEEMKGMINHFLEMKD